MNATSDPGQCRPDSIFLGFPPGHPRWNFDQLPVHPLARKLPPLSADDVPASSTGKTIYPHQVEGINFLLQSWSKQRNVILGDEMGLGKAMQTALFLFQLKHQGNDGPFLIVAPLWTVPHWQQELTDWTDQITVAQTHPSVAVLLTTSDLLLGDCELLSGVKGRRVVVDEAQRLETRGSAAFTAKALESIGTDFKILIRDALLQDDTTSCCGS
jgi:chromodomain-helicase-DNA-binding protein 7